MSEIILKHNYVNSDITYIKDAYINEWDIQSAGFSVLKFKKILSVSDIEYLENLDKITRNIKIGVLQKSITDLPKIILSTLAEVRQKFYNANAIHDSRILSIKKDAVIVIDTPINVTHFDEYFNFILKGDFTSYVRIGMYEFYVNSFRREMVIKGMGSDIKQTGILKLIKDTIIAIEALSPDQTYAYLKNIQHKYLSMELPVECYKNFTIDKYELIDLDITVDDISSIAIKDVDISQNYLNLLLPLMRSIF